jgi:hypothetical protein
VKFICPGRHKEKLAPLSQLASWLPIDVSRNILLPSRTIDLTRTNHVGNISGNFFYLIVEIVEDLVIFCSLVIEVFREIATSLLLEPSISVRNIPNYDLSAD